VQLEALIFDVDGTLSETEEAHRAAFNEAFAEAGLGWSWDQALYRELLKVTGGKERIRHFMNRAAPDDLTRPDADAWIAGLHKRKTAIYTAMVDDGAVALRPGVAPLLEAARRLGVAATDCLYVGDDERDVIAGRAAGMATAVAAWGYLGPQARYGDWGADAALNSPGDLLKLLGLA